ncbi:FK506-binding protein 2A [Pseudocyphellaria aurata]|nr:FK506-binding protein 2A [Pseudocyphellaria aurata]
MHLPMNPTSLLLSFLALLSISPAALAAEVTTEYTVTKECTRKSQRGDTISVHYRGTLASDGSQFDASYDRDQPLDFTVGQGMVIKGWDEGLLDMCPGDKRKLTIPPEYGYGERSMGPIPASSTLSAL